MKKMFHYILILSFVGMIAAQNNYSLEDLNLTSSTTIGIKLAAVSNVDTVSNQGNKISEHTYLLIMKIS